MSGSGRDVPEVEGRRALMTEREREIIAGIDTYDQKRYELASHLRNRAEKLREDMEWLAEHHPRVARQIQDEVCGVDVPDVGIPEEE